MSKKILIVGGNGFVGSNLARALSKEHTVHATYYRNFTPIENVTYHFLSQIADKDLCRAISSQVMPNVVIYCVGKNDLAHYENDQTLAQYIFSAGPVGMLAATEIIKPKFILISSDYAFQGNEGNYSETDSPLAFSQLGKAKVRGENYAKTRSLNYSVIRCAPLLGRGPMDHQSWLDGFRENFIQKKPISVLSKTYRNPVHISALITTVQAVIQQDIKNKFLHVGGLSKVSLFELVNLFAQRFDFDPSLISASDTEQNSVYDYSLNFTDSLKLIQTEPLLLEQSFNLLE
jgi:dTDP-4-dehydrorhamnose reductase